VEALINKAITKTFESLHWNGQSLTKYVAAKNTLSGNLIYQKF
jgi:hypothetical protein